MIETTNVITEDYKKLQANNKAMIKALAELADILTNRIHECPPDDCDEGCQMDGCLGLYAVAAAESVVNQCINKLGIELDK